MTVLQKRVTFSLNEMLEIESGLTSMQHLYQANLNLGEDIAYSQYCLKQCETAMKKVTRAKTAIWTQGGCSQAPALVSDDEDDA